MTIIVRSMYNFVNCLQFNIRYVKVERPAPVGSALVFNNVYILEIDMRIQRVRGEEKKIQKKRKKVSL